MGTPKTTTNKSWTELPPWVSQAYQDLFKAAYGAAGTPFKPYTDQRVAGINGDMRAAFRDINKLGAKGRPDMQRARTWADRAGKPIAGQVPGLTKRYLDPYLKEVVANAQKDFEFSDASAQNDLLGRAISSGASPFGGDRAGVAAAELARGQSQARNTALGNLRSQGYTSARDTALRALTGDQSAAGNAANLYAGLGNSAFNQASQAANARLQSGLLQQKNSQDYLDTRFQDFMREQNYPWEQIQRFAQTIKGSGDLGNVNYEEKPAPSPWNALIGLIPSIFGMLKPFSAGSPASADPYGWSNQTWMKRGGRPQHARAGLAVDWEDDRRPGSSVERIWDLPDIASPVITTPSRPATLGSPPPPAAPVVAEPAAAGPVAVKPRRSIPGLDSTGLKPGTLSALMGDIAGDPLRYGLVAGGLATMGSESPWPLVALGQGLSAGFKAAAERRGDLDRIAQQKAEKEAELALRQAELDAQSVVLDQGDTIKVFHPSTGEIIDTGIPVVRQSQDTGTANERVAQQFADSTGAAKGSPEWVTAYQGKYAQLTGTGAGLAVDANGRPVGDPPTDMAWKYGPDGRVEVGADGAPIAIPIGGTPTAIKNEKEARERELASTREGLRAERTERTSSRVSDMIKDALKTVYEPGIISALEGSNVGALGNIVAGLPVITPTKVLKNIVHGIQSNVGVDTLNRMRQENANGASGFGQLTEKELAVLTGLFGDLDNATTPEQYTKTLARIYNEYNHLAYQGTSDTDPDVKSTMEEQMPPMLPETGLSKEDVDLYGRLLSAQIPDDSGTPQPVTEADIQETMKATRKSRDEVVRLIVDRYGRRR